MVAASVGLGLDLRLTSLLKDNFYFEHQTVEKFDFEILMLKDQLGGKPGDVELLGSLEREEKKTSRIRQNEYL